MQRQNSTALPNRASRDILEHLRQTANAYRLHPSRDECGDLIIRGRAGQIFAYDSVHLGVLVFCPSKTAWTYAKKKLLAAGFRLLQDCDTEGTATFDPQQSLQVNLAIGITRISERRHVSPETKARLASFSRSRRNIAGRAILALGTNVGEEEYVPPHASKVAPTSGSPATKPDRTDGAK